MKRFFLALLIMMFFAVPAMAEGEQGDGHVHADPPGSEDVVRISPADLMKRIEAGANIMLLDLRSRGAYDNSDVKIKGAVRIAPDELPAKLHQIPFGKEIVTFCT